MANPYLKALSNLINNICGQPKTAEHYSCSALLCSAVSISLCIQPCQPLFSKKNTKLLMAEKATFFSGNWLTQWAPIALRRRLAPGLLMNLIADIIPYKSSMNKSKIRIKSNKFIFCFLQKSCTGTHCCLKNGRRW